MEKQIQIPLSKIECFFGTDVYKRHFVAGRCGSGKTMVLMGIAQRLDYQYLNNEMQPINDERLSCDSLIKSFDKNIKGIVLDCTHFWFRENLIDFKTYKWNIPIWYSVQLNPYNSINQVDRDYFGLWNIGEFS